VFFTLHGNALGVIILLDCDGLIVARERGLCIGEGSIIFLDLCQKK
jgi:hypothetical protein